MSKEKQRWEPVFEKVFFWYIPKDFEDLSETDNAITHKFCGTYLHIGKRNSDGALFYFCPRCRVQIKDTEGNFI